MADVAHDCNRVYQHVTPQQFVPLRIVEGWSRTVTITRTSAIRYAFYRPHEVADARADKKRFTKHVNLSVCDVLHLCTRASRQVFVSCASLSPP